MKTKTYLKILFVAFLIFAAVPASAVTIVDKVSSGSGVVYLPLVMNASNQQPPTATSIQLIKQALADGRLDAKTAAIYEVYSILPNSPLPAEYVGAPDPQVDIAPFSALSTVYDTLSSAQKAAVDPYLRRPDDQTSAFFKFQQEQARQQAGWQSVGGVVASSTRPPDSIKWDDLLSTTGVRIHYRLDIDGDEAKAVDLAAAIDAKIYNALNTLMGRVWLDDTGCAGGGVEDDGGGGALDIYLMHGMTARGLEVSCHETPTPGWVILNADRPIGDDTHIGMVQTASHEMFHAIQDSYTYLEDDYLWVQEATAKWVEDYVYHNAQSEQDYAHLYLDTTQNPLDDNPDGLRYYGEYLWPFYLYRVKGYNPNFIRTMFENAKSYRSTDIFMLSGGSDDPVTLFPDFAVKNWNQAPFDNYKTVDTLTKRVVVQYQDVISGVVNKQPYILKNATNAFTHLSATYYDYVFADDTARTVAFYNGLTYKLTEGTGVVFLDPQSVGYKTDPLEYNQIEGMNVQALIKINDAWTREDWSSGSQKIYCRDRAAQNIQELVLIITNSNFKDSQANYTFHASDLYPILLVSPTGCYQWKGTITRTDTSDPGVTDTLTGEDIIFEASDSLFSPNVFYTLKSGSLTLSMHGASSDGVDKYAVDGGVTLTPDDGNNSLYTYNLVTGGPQPNAYYGDGSSNQSVKGTHWICCNEDGSWEYNSEDFFIGTWFMAPWMPIDQRKFQTQGNILEGSYTYPNSDITWTWHFVAQKEP
jgi:hypothetical protein